MTWGHEPWPAPFIEPWAQSLPDGASAFYNMASCCLLFGIFPPGRFLEDACFICVYMVRFEEIDIIQRLEREARKLAEERAAVQRKQDGRCRWALQERIR